MLGVIAEEILATTVSHKNSSAKKMKLCPYWPQFNLEITSTFSTTNDFQCWFDLKEKWNFFKDCMWDEQTCSYF